MSYIVQNLAWKVEGLKPSTKFILIALCDYANKQEFTAWPSHNLIVKRTGLSISSVQRAIKCLCDRGLLSYRNRFDEKGHKQTNLYQINLSFPQELTAPPDKVVMITPSPNHNDGRNIVTVTDKPLPPAFNLTNKFKNFGEEVVGTNFDRRPISRERMLEICKEMGYDLE